MKMSFDLYTNSAETAAKFYCAYSAVIDSDRDESISLNIYSGAHNLCGTMDFTKINPKALKAAGFVDCIPKLENDYDEEEIDWDDL